MQGARLVIGAVAALLFVAVCVWGYGAWSDANEEALLDLKDPTPEQIERIVALLDSDDSGVQVRVQERVSQLGDKAEAGLMKLAKTPDARVGARKNAAEMLWYIDEDKFFEALRVLLDPATMPDAGGRVTATGILTFLRRQDPRAEELIQLCAKDPAPGPRGFAAENLGPASISFLQQLTRDPVEYVASHAKRHLREVQQSMRR